MGSLQNDGIDADSRASGTRKHSESLPRNKQTGGIDRAIKAACDPYPVTRQRLLDLFDNRAPFTSIKLWRYGWTRPPAWAIELLQTKLEARRQELYRVLATIEGRLSGPGERGTRHLAAWRERKARERDEKEKQNAVDSRNDGKL